MDKSRGLCGLLLLLIVTSISCQQKTEDSVYVEESQKPLGQGCYSEAIPNKFLVYYEDGTVGTVFSPSVEELKAKFIKPNLKNIRWVEHDQKVLLEDTQVKASEVVPSMLAEITWGQTNAQAPLAWSKNIKGGNVVVGIVDSGVDHTHPQLKSQILVNAGEVPENGLDDDQNGYIDDYYSYDFFAKRGDFLPTQDHGSHVAGVIAGSHEGASFQLGMAPEARLVATNFLSHVKNQGGNLEDAIAAIKYTVSRGAKIINASWGGAPCSAVLAEVIASLEAQNVLIVVAAGNEHSNIDYFPTYPAAYNLPTQITVGAIGPSNIMTGFSNFGDQMVHIMAPGDQIYSTVIGGYDTMAGTSMAAPFVTGAAALLWGHRPAATAKQIKQALLTSVTKSNYRVTTRGRLDVATAITELERVVPQ